MKKLILSAAILASAFGSQAQLAPGSVAPDFTVTAYQSWLSTAGLNGNGTYKLYDYLDAGYTVILDVSATWCGPCIAELPNVKKAYDDWHKEGFEILGISFDQEGQEEKVREFLKDRELPWTQVYEGKGWDTKLGAQYDVSGIPFVLLVDGDSGQILGTSKELRGEKLSDFIAEKLKEKKGGQ